jgi:hypothetical protein
MPNSSAMRFDCFAIVLSRSRRSLLAAFSAASYAASRASLSFVESNSVSSGSRSAAVNSNASHASCSAW